MRLHTIEDIRREVTGTALNKAVAYQRQHRAVVTSMADDGSLIEGRVQGTRSRPYAVAVRLQVLDNGGLRVLGRARALSGSTASTSRRCCSKA